MNGSAVDTHAVVVGIENYGAGDSWNKLNGPVPDAFRLIKHLRCTRRVPAANIRAFLAPRPDNQGLTARTETLLGHSVERPDQANFDDLIEHELPGLKAGLLVFFWAGHGLMTLADERRLYTADMTATSKRNLDLNAMMAALRSDRYPHLPRQIIIIDACANYSLDAASTLPHRNYGAGAGVARREQFVLCATTAGGYARNREGAGLMAREFLALLETDAESGGTWPPDFQSLAEKLSERFAAMRTEGTARQTPGTLWFRSPSAEEFLSVVGTAKSITQSELSLQQYGQLIDAVLAVPSMANPIARERIILGLGANIAYTIQRGNTVFLDVQAIVDRCRQYNGGLAKLIEILEMQERGGAAAKNLRDVASSLLPAEISKAF